MALTSRRWGVTTLAVIALLASFFAQHTATYAADSSLTLVRGDIGVTLNEGGQLPTNQIYGIFNDPDQCAGGGDYSVTIDFGDGPPGSPDTGTSAGGVVEAVPDPGGGCNWDVRLVSGFSNLYLEEDTYHIVFTVQDAGGNILSIASTATVGDAPLTSSGAAVANRTEGSSFTASLGTFTDSSGYCEQEGPWPGNISPEQDATHYLATVDWGDGSQSLGTVTRRPGTCTFDVGGTHTYTEEGTHSVHVTVQDEGGSQTAFDTSITAGDAALSIVTTNTDNSPIDYNLAGFEGQPLTTTEGQPNPALAVFHDSNPNCDVNDYSAYVIWNDGSNPDKAIIRQRFNTLPGDCQFTVLDPHTVANTTAATPYSVRIYDQGVEVDQTAGTYTVYDSALTPVQPGTAVLSSNDANSRELLGTFRDGGCGYQWEFYASAVSFGDGGTDVGQVSIAPSADGNPCDWDVLGSHVYGSPGRYSTSVTVQDFDGASVTVTGNSNVDVNDAPLTLVRGNIGETIPEGGSLASSTIYGVFHDPDQCSGGSGDFSLTADLGDGTPTQPDIVTTNIQAVPDAGGSCNWDVELDPHWFNVYIEEGTYHVVWTVKDAGGNLLSIPSTVQVPDAPLTSSGSTLPTILEGTTFSGQLGTFNDANSNLFFPADCEQEGNWPPGQTNPAEPDATHYHGSVTWGDGAVTDATITHVGGACAFSVSASHTYNEEGTYTIHVQIQDEGGSVTFFDSTITVADAALSSESQQSPISTQQHLTLTNQLMGKFSDADPLCTVADYSATINWADGVEAPGVVERDPVAGGCTFDVFGEHTYSSVNLLTPAARITVFDTAGSSTVWTDKVSVTPYDSPLVLARGDVGVTIPEGGHLPSATIYGVFDDPDQCGSSAPGDFTYIAADLGDGTPTHPDLVGGVNGFQSYPWGSVKILSVVKDTNVANTCLWDVELAPGWANFYSEENVYHIVFTVQDSAGNTVSIASTATVVDAPLTPHSANLAPVDEGSAFTTTLGTFDDANNNMVWGPDCENEGQADITLQNPYAFGPEPDSSHYLATVDWGDGSSTRGTVVQQPNSCTFTVGGSHTYAEEGTYPVHVSIHDEGSAVTAFNDSLTVTDAALGQVAAFPIAATEGQAVSTGKLGTFSDPDPGCSAGDYTATVQWGDGGTSPGTISITPGSACTFDVYAGGHVYSEEGPLNNAQIVVVDHGPALIIPLTGTVADAPLTVQTPLGGSSAGCTLLTSCKVTAASFTDGSPNCTSEGSPAELLAIHYPISIDWGDGSPADTASAVVTQRPGTCTFDVAGTHVYTSPTAAGAPRTVTVTIHDEGGSVTSSSAVTATVTVPSIGVSSKLYKANASFKSTPFTIAETLMYSNSNGTFNASLNFSDTTQGLSIPNCSTSPSASCRLTILGFQSAYTSSTAKAATIWARYVYTSGGSSVTRYARLDLTDADPSTADGISIRMSSAANPTLPATSPAAPTTYTGAVTIS